MRAALAPGDLLAPLEVVVDDRDAGGRTRVVAQSRADRDGARHALREVADVVVVDLVHVRAESARGASVLEAVDVRERGRGAVDAREAGHERAHPDGLHAAARGAVGDEVLPVPLRQRLEKAEHLERAEHHAAEVVRRHRPLAVELLVVVRLAVHLAPVAVDVHLDAVHVVREPARAAFRGVVVAGELARRLHSVRGGRRLGDHEVAGGGQVALGRVELHAPQAEPGIRARDLRALDHLERQVVDDLALRRPVRVEVLRLRPRLELLDLHARAALEEHALLPSVILRDALPRLVHDVRLDLHESRAVERRADHERLRERRLRAPLLRLAVVRRAHPVDEVFAGRDLALHALQLEREDHLLARRVEALVAVRAPEDERVVPVHRAVRGQSDRANRDSECHSFHVTPRFLLRSRARTPGCACHTRRRRPRRGACGPRSR